MNDFYYGYGLETEDLYDFGAGFAEDNLYTSGLEDGYGEQAELLLDELEAGAGLALFEDTTSLLEGFRAALADEYQDLHPDQLEDALFDILEELPPAEGFSLTSALRTVGEAGSSLLKDPSVSQIAGAALGTAIGGPAGMAIGSQLGQVAGSAISGARKPAPTKAASAGSQPSTPAAGAPAAAPVSGSPPPVPGGSAAANQLLQLFQNKDVLKGMLALALGPYGRPSVKVGQQGPDVNLGAIINVLDTLVHQAAQDADELQRGGTGLPDYLLDSEGEFLIDPAIPEERARVLYGALSAAEEGRLFGEDVAPAEPWSHFFPFPKGARLLVEYETRLRDLDIGKAWVLEHQPDTLKLKLHVDEWDLFNVPETDAVFTIQYKQEGAGNLATVNVNGQTYTDKNVTIRSKKGSREISLSISILGQSVDRVRLVRNSPKKARLVLKAQGDEHVLILTPD